MTNGRPEFFNDAKKRMLRRRDVYDFDRGAGVEDTDAYMRGIVEKMRRNKKDGYGFVDTGLVGLAGKPIPEDLGDRIIESIVENMDKECVVTGDVVVIFSTNGGGDYTGHFEKVAGPLAQAMLDDAFSIKRVVIPLSMAQQKLGGVRPPKEDHAAVMCIDTRDKKKFQVIVLEQWASNDGGKLDFSKEVGKIAGWTKWMLESQGADVSVKINSVPFCDTQRVCGVVQARTAEQLLLAAEPARLVDNIKPIRPEKIQKQMYANAAAKKGME